MADHFVIDGSNLATEGRTEPSLGDIDHLDSPRAPASDGLPHVSVEARLVRPGRLAVSSVRPAPAFVFGLVECQTRIPECRRRSPPAKSPCRWQHNNLTLLTTSADFAA